MGLTHPDLHYQRALGSAGFWQSTRSALGRNIYAACRARVARFSLLLGISIPPEVFGRRLSIARYSSLVVSDRAWWGSSVVFTRHQYWHLSGRCSSGWRLCLHWTWCCRNWRCNSRGRSSHCGKDGCVDRYSPAGHCRGRSQSCHVQPRLFVHHACLVSEGLLAGRCELVPAVKAFLGHRVGLPEDVPSVGQFTEACISSHSMGHRS
jgi:hypothetical protein